MSNPLLFPQDALTGAGGESRTFFVPLCGKSVDLLHLYRAGHTVVGTEAAEDGCRGFFKESELEFKEEAVGKFKVFRTGDSR